MNIDFQLASTYFPVFLCTLKLSILLVSGFWLIPRGMVTFLLAVLQLDRIYTNSEFIFDINYTLLAWTLFELANSNRFLFGFPSNATHVIHICWALCLLVRPRYLTVSCLFFFILSGFTHTVNDSFLWLVFRGFLYLVFVILKMYISAYFKQQQNQLHVLLLGGVILSSHVAIAIVFFVVAALVLAFQNISKNQEQLDLESQVLRQALASRKTENVKE